MTDDNALRTRIESMGRAARAAAGVLARTPTSAKDNALRAVAARLRENSATIIEANEKDVAAGRETGLSDAMIDRLVINEDCIEKMAVGAEAVADLPDPVGEVVHEWSRPNGMRLAQVRVPVGVISLIYESRPNVTVDAAVLCLKSGNASILRGGSEAFNTNMALAAEIKAAVTDAGLPAETVQLVDTTDRAAVEILLGMEKYLDMVVPRGGKGLIETVSRLARVPVIKHYDGICHVYVDKSADLDMAAKICFNAKVQRPGVCNAMETLLVHESVADEFLPVICHEYLAAGVEVRGCEKTCDICAAASPATEEDWRTEYLDLTVSIRIVDSIDDAVDHIAKYGSQHTDAIVTEDESAAERFLRDVDSSSVFVNLSTRFSDGFEYGFGAELGISTSRIHCRGPMGLRELTCTKYTGRGTGQIRS
jgi:glutamate-5-semialdehyde dehydrogenase